MADPLIFDFITDETFRAGLLQDAREMEKCSELEAWKAVYVLSGSIVEAVLVDHLLSIGQTNPDPLKMELGELIKDCRKAGVLSQKTSELSSALKSYRNLIHPGRVLRLQERVDRDGAMVAQALVSIIVHEVAAKRLEEHGLTAEQIVRKVETDPSALGIAEHLLGDARPEELQRLLLKILPSHYVAESQRDEFADHEILDRLAALYRVAFAVATDDVKRTVMKRYVTVLKEEIGALVEIYEEQFFRASHMEFASISERKVIKDHLFARIKHEASVNLIDAMEGLGAYLAATSTEVNAFVDPLVRAGAAPTSGRRGKAALKRLESEAGRTSAEADKVINARLDAWIDLYRERDRQDTVKAIEVVKEAYDVIPF